MESREFMQDTVATEDLTEEDIIALALPQSWWTYRQFASSFGLAGVLHMLHSYSRCHPKAWHHHQILDVYQNLFQNKISQQTLCLESLLGYYSLDLVKEVVVTPLEDNGFELAGLNELKVAKSIMHRLLFDCIENSATQPIIALREKLQEEQSCEDNGDRIDIPCIAKSKFESYFHRLDGKQGQVLQYAEKTLLESLACIESEPIEAEILLGTPSRGKKVLLVVLPTDIATNRIDYPWRELWKSFTNTNTGKYQDNDDSNLVVALIFHLTNHYAIIFALRGWNDGHKMIHQVLTARKGQRPTAWIDFTKVHSILLHWVNMASFHLP
ncbi:hypothetical protein THRCLA_21077 [Thraustotheca clavata]|uniref:Uncharacterized protein n=1 Tax=Thraustotheca clavata TaxID=74557 RepID=A0A1W0A0G2_9STRA|nr:hypothetical protein THRCLA_21077 [Thraustotheca clavata]